MTSVVTGNGWECDRLQQLLCEKADYGTKNRRQGRLLVGVFELPSGLWALLQPY